MFIYALRFMRLRRRFITYLLDVRFVVLTPDGVHTDRRKISSNYHMVNERRIIEIIRRKILLMFDDNEPQSS